MAHLIDTSNNRNNIAYVGETPWHGLGQALTPGLGIDDWRREAGLDFSVDRSAVEYGVGGQRHVFHDRHVLHRSDTGAALSVVSKDYKIVQPGQVLEFFRDLTQAGGFELETAGALSGGKRVWALAKIGDGANIIGQDLVRPYLLLATSFDGGMATVAKFTSVRVVCHNTISMAINSSGEDTKSAIVNAVRVNHSDTFDAAKIRRSLGIALQAWDKFLLDARLLADKELDPETADSLTYDLIEPTISQRSGSPAPDVRQTRGYRRLMDLFSGQAIGSELTEGPTGWNWLNAVTQWVDHERGRTRDTGLDSAWFGAGNALKSRALELVLAA